MVKQIKNISLTLWFAACAVQWSCNNGQKSLLVFYDEFDQLRSGDMFSNVGAHTEYHYLKEAGPKGNWALSGFRFENSWGVQRDGGDKIILQKRRYFPKNESHPMIIAGDELWKNYSVEARFLPLEQDLMSGITFRCRNDRQNYFFGVVGKKAILKIVDNGTGFYIPKEKILAEAPYDYKLGSYLVAKINIENSYISAKFENGPVLTAVDSTFKKGKIGLIADVPTRYSYVKVFMDEKDQLEWKNEKNVIAEEEKKLQLANPKLKLWKKINTEGFGVGRNLRFGDLNGDGEVDVLIGQVNHHGPMDAYSELSCLTAMTLDGQKLWQVGVPDPWKNNLTNDVAFQIHDIDNDGANEVIYTRNMEIFVAEGSTGKIKYKAPTPLIIPDARNKDVQPFPRILGDCLYFCDLQGKGYAGNIIIKDRYENAWALDSRLNILWHFRGNTGHYPFSLDIDADGKDEIVIGYTLLNHEGKVIWTLENQIKDHADGVAIVDPKNSGQLRYLSAASDEGMLFADISGRIIKHHFIGHVQNPSVLNLRDDLPGLETVSVNFWGSQGIVHYYDADGNIYYDFEPGQYGSMMLPLNWTGRSEEFFVLNANVEEGGIYDGYGRRVVVFPDDGHPDMCNAVLNITGDCRDEIVVWDPETLWIYTQSDNPKSGKIYCPSRNPLYNYSNYQTTVSIPGWNK